MNSIKERRMALGMSRARLARMIGCCGTTIKSWEDGKHPPSDEALSRIADVLGCPKQDLYTDADRIARQERISSFREKAAPYRNQRISMGLTQKELAEKAGVNLKTIKDLEYGKAWPGWQTRKKLRCVLGMPEERCYPESCYTDKERNAIFLELEEQGLIRAVIRKNYQKLRAVHTDFDDLYQELALCVLQAIDRYQPEGPASLKTFVSRNAEFRVKHWIAKSTMHGLSGTLCYPLPDVRTVSLEAMMENGFDPVEGMEDFVYTGEQQRKRPHTQPADQSACV